MIFNFNNIGIVESAEIELKGLTVLAGLNDTGKSFLSKTIFSIIKTNREASRETRSAKFQRLQMNFASMQQGEMHACQGLTKDAINNLQPQVNINDLFTKIATSFNSAINISIDDIKRGLSNYKERVNNAFALNPNKSILPIQNQIIHNTDKNIKEIINLLENRIEEPEKEYIAFFNSVIIPQLFRGQINTLNKPESNIHIKFCDDSENDVNVVIKNNNCIEFKNSVGEIFNDAIYIESPTTLQLVSFISNTLAFGANLINATQQRIAGLPYHIYDLVFKIVNNANNTPGIDYSNYLNEVRTTIGGKLYYDQVTRSIQYLKGNDKIIMDLNTASGIKGLGIIDILISENILNNKTLLIIDEPEVHQHPLWEIEYAKLLIQLSKAGIPIIVSSHSPYFIEAIAKHSELEKYDDKVNFYFGGKVNGVTKFEDVTNNLNTIFEKLAEPMKILTNLKNKE